LTVKTFLDINVRDAQGYQATLRFRIAPLAFAAAQTVPTATEINAVINSLFGSGVVPSNASVLGYSVVINQDDAALGGEGDSPISESLRVRSNIGGLVIPFMFAIPGLAKSNVVYDPTNPNAVSTASGMWDTIRTALTAAHIAIAPIEPDTYDAVASDDLAQVATVYDGRRAPMRPR
jgi:hypothetical protein